MVTIGTGSIRRIEPRARTRGNDPGVLSQPDSTVSAGRGSTPGSSSLSAWRGFSTASRSPSPATPRASSATSKRSTSRRPTWPSPSGPSTSSGRWPAALFFGRLSDKWGRRNLFMITLGVYLFGGVLTALTFGHSPTWVYWLWISRFIAGMGIGGEYAAINSAIDELIPAKYRGRVDIAVNGTYWGGALIATLLTMLVVNHLPVSYSWRVAFLVGPALGFVILFVRKNLPESPRWLLMHGGWRRPKRAVSRDRAARRSTAAAVSVTSMSPRPSRSPRPTISASSPWPGRCSSTIRSGPSSVPPLMITQSFLYNAIFFTYSLVLTKIYNVPATDTAYYFIFFALGNLIGPLTIGRLFDTIGRRKMIAGTYILSGILLAISAFLFNAGVLNAVTQTACWCVIFFFASAGASRPTSR